MKKFFYILFLPFILIACGDDEPSSDFFSFEVTEKPSDTEVSYDGTDCGISTNGEAQTITVTINGDYDSFRVISGIPDWSYTTSSDKVVKFKLNQFTGDETDVRSADIIIAVTKGKQSVNGHIIIHQYAVNASIPPLPVYLKFNSLGEWQTYGVTSALSSAYFNKEKNIPENFPFATESATGFGGILLVSDINGNPIAFDAACPVESDAKTIVSVETENYHAVCAKCGSHFDIVSNPGMPISGIALQKGYAMMKYKVSPNSKGAYTITR